MKGKVRVRESVVDNIDERVVEQLRLEGRSRDRDSFALHLTRVWCFLSTDKWAQWIKWRRTGNSISRFRDRGM